MKLPAECLAEGINISKTCCSSDFFDWKITAAQKARSLPQTAAEDVFSGRDSCSRPEFFFQRRTGHSSGTGKIFEGYALCQISVDILKNP